MKLATHALTKEKVAVKIIDKTKLDKSTAKKLFREVRIMKLLGHEHIVRLYEVIDTPKELFLIMEYAVSLPVIEFESVLRSAPVPLSPCPASPHRLLHNHPFRSPLCSPVVRSSTTWLRTAA